MWFGASSYNLEGLRDGITWAGENVFWTDDPNLNQHTGAIIDADCRDLGNVGTTTFLRAGLALHRQASNDQYIHHEPGVYGRHRIDALLLWPVNMLQYTTSGSSATEKKVPVMIAGRIKPDRIYNPQAAGYAGAVTTPSIVGASNEFSMKRMLANRFTWQDRVAVGGAPFFDAVALTASQTLTADDHNFLFTNTGASGAVVATLPALQRGLTFWFYTTVAQSFQYASAAGGDLVYLNDAAANSVSFSTSSEIIGGGAMVYCDGTKWLNFPFVWDTQTVVPAT